MDSMQDRFATALAMEGDKPDAKVQLDLGSPVSPLRGGGAAALTSSSSSSSGSMCGKQPAANAAAPRRSVASGSHSGELRPKTPAGSDHWPPRPGHRRMGSSPLVGSSGSGGGSGAGASASASTASSPVAGVLPAGNICPSGRVATTGMLSRAAPRSDVLRSGTGSTAGYGHGSVVRGGGGEGRPRSGAGDPAELTRLGNEQYKRGRFMEALRHYDLAVSVCPENAACRGNRAAALAGLGRIVEAAVECEKAVGLDPVNGRSHHRLGLLYLRLGLVEEAWRHLFLNGQQPDPTELQKLQAVESHLGRCLDSRKKGDWKTALKEGDAAIMAGADSSPLLNASRAEALLRLHQLNEADSSMSKALKLANSCLSQLQVKFFGMASDSYLHIVWAQVDMALGRFENAVTVAEKANQVESRNIEVVMVFNNAKAIARARLRGNELFKAGKFVEACAAYSDGLKHEPSNPILYCNRAACRAKIGQFEKSLEDCNEALRVYPSYTKALLRRATSYSMLERWVEAARDYEVLRKELPDDKEVAEASFRAQVALKTSRCEDVSNLKFGGEVEEIIGLEQFQAEMTLPGVSVVFFMTGSNPQCIKITPFIDGLCRRFPSVNFLKVDVNGSPAVAKAENVRIVPTFKIYKNGTRVKEMICPSYQVLECSVRHYSL